MSNKRILIGIRLSMWPPLRNSASFQRIDPSSNRKDFTTLMFFFRKTIVNKGWKAIFQPLRPVSTMVVREFYANLVANVLKKIQVRGVLVEFSVKDFNEYYNLEPVNFETYDRLHEALKLPRGS